MRGVESQGTGASEDVDALVGAGRTDVDVIVWAWLLWDDGKRAGDSGFCGV